MKKFNYNKVDYSTIKKGVSFPIAFISNGTIKTKFATIRQDEKGFYIMLNKVKQYVEKSNTSYKGITTIVTIGENAITKKSVKKVATKQAEKQKATKEKVATKRAKKESKRIKANEDEKYLVPNMVVPSINHLEFLSFEAKTTILELLTEKASKWNALNGIHKHDKYYYFNDVTNILVNAQMFEEVQTSIVMLLAENINYMSYKMLEFGAKYKQKEKHTTDELQNIMSYQKASTNNGKITFIESNELVNELVALSFEKIFSEEMFESKQNVFMSLYFRVSNALRKAIRENSKFKASIGNDEIVQVIDKNNKAYNPENIENIIELASTIVKFTDKEKEILSLRLQGYSKKEIDEKTNTRNDRTYQSYMAKLQEKSGISIKEIKQQMKQEEENEKARKKAMKEEIKARKQLA